MYNSHEAAKILGVSYKYLCFAKCVSKRAIFSALEQLGGIVKKGKQLYYTDAALELLASNGLGSRCIAYCPVEEKEIEFEVSKQYLETIFKEGERNED